jgi:hypothetical protein
MEVPASNIDYIVAANTYKDDKVQILSTYVLFLAAVETTEKLVTDLEASDDDTVRTLISDENVINAVFQPFFGTYYTPYTRYSDKVKNGDAYDLDIPACIKQLSDLIERIFVRIEKMQCSQAKYKAARKGWAMVSALYSFRMKNPFVDLSCKKQEEYCETIKRLIKDVCSLSHEVDDSEVDSEQPSVGGQKDELAQNIAKKTAEETMAALKPTLDAVGKATDDRTKGMKALDKQLSEIKRIANATLNCVSEGAQGMPLEDGRCILGLRKEMVEEGFLCVRDKKMNNLSSVARKIIKKYAGKAGAYSDKESDTLRRAISRRCKAESICVKAMQGES